MVERRRVSPAFTLDRTDAVGADTAILPRMPRAPEITVAAVTEADGRFLVVEERINQRLVLNQPAGHLEQGESLFAAAAREALEETGHRPVRAVQRISAANLGEADARILDVPAGSASLNIERISYLASGKVVEFTRSIYRGDTYDFVAELRLAGPAEATGG